MRVTLIYCQVLDGNNVVPPLGCMYLGAVLEKAGHMVQLIDVDHEYYDNLTREVRDFKPDLIGLSFMTVQYDRAFSLMEKLKKELPDVTYCAGGVHPTIRPEETMNEIEFDFLVIGEGEETIVEACEKLEKKEGLAGVKGLVYRDNGKIINNGRRDLIKDLDSIPFPARHLLDLTPYLKLPGIIRGAADKNQTTMITSRGCPFRCIYCGSHNMWGRRTRRRSVKNVVDEMEHINKKYGITGLYFCDDTFTLNSRWVREFCHELKSRELNMKWAGHARVDEPDEELLTEMRDAGLVQLDFGVENGSEKILKILGKGGRADRAEVIKKSFELCKKLGIRTLSTFIIGNPEETIEDINESFKMAKDLDADYTTVYYLSPYPGTEIYDMAIKNGWLRADIPFSLQWAHRQPELPIMSITFGKEEIAKIRRKFQNAFFAKNYLKNTGNLNFYMILGSIIFRHPTVIFKAIWKVLKTRRLDYAAEILNTEYWRMKKYEGA